MLHWIRTTGAFTYEGAMGQNILTQSGVMRRVFTTNDATVGTAITNPTDTLTRPSGEGIIEMTNNDGGLTLNALFLKPYGVGSDTNTFLMSVFGWDKIVGISSTTKEQWTATLLASFTCTLTTVTGVAGGILGTSDKYCDTIAIGVGNANVSNEIVSPTGDVIAHIVLDTKGCPVVQIKMCRNGSATSENCLARPF